MIAQEAIHIARLSESAILPKRMTEGSAGIDLYACTGRDIEPGKQVLVGTGVSVSIPKGYVGLLALRSSLAAKRGVILGNGVGVIDSDYRGEVGVLLRNCSASVVSIYPGERIAQLVIVPYLSALVQEVGKLVETDRTGGFGSTGVR